MDWRGAKIAGVDVVEARWWVLVSGGVGGQ